MAGEDRTHGGRYQTRSGEIVPSVTGIIGQLNKPALVKWANKMGMRGIDTETYVSDAAIVGTIAHRLVEARWKDEDYDTIHQELVDEYGAKPVQNAIPSVMAYSNWEKDRDFQVLMTETKLVSEKYFYGGTADCIAFLDNEIVLIDLKTGSGIYPDYLIQAAAYAQAAKEVHGFDIKQAHVLNIPKDSKRPLTVGIAFEDELKIGWEVFVRLLDLYFLRDDLQFNRIIGV